MDSQKSNKETITKEQLIRFIAEEYDLNLKTTRQIYSSLENKIKYLLSGANPTKEITVKLFEGITLNSRYIPAKEKIDNLTGNKMMINSRLGVKANVSRRFIEKLNKRC